MDAATEASVGRREVWRARNPRTGAEDYSFAVATRQDVAAAVARVRAAQPAWAAMGAENRIGHVRAFGAALARHRNAIVAALAEDTGRYRIATVETDSIGPMIERVAGDARALLAPDPYRNTAFPGIEAHNQLVPYPVVGVISPWNFPLLLAMVDALPALLAGAAVVLKPSEVTPRHVDPLLAAVGELPALAAVLAIVRGPGRTGADLIDHVDAVAFTGSVRTGRLVAQHAAERFIPAFLELGGNDPAIVMPSADVELAAATLLRGSIAATGQACQSVERIYVHESIFEQFVRCLADGARRVRFNYPDIMSGNIGPLIFARQADVIREHLDEAVARGARIVTGGNIVDLGGGLYCEATVLTHTDHTMKVVMEETFGPIMPVMSFRTADEAVRLANDSIYGLSASVFSADRVEAEDIAARLNAGVISINDASLSAAVHEVENEPFNWSGMGRSRMGPAGVARYLRKKAILRNNYPALGLAAYSEPNA